MVGFCCSAARFFAHFHHVVEIYFWIHKIGFSLFLSMLHYCWWLLFCFWWYCCVAAAAAAAIWPDFFLRSSPPSHSPSRSSTIMHCFYSRFVNECIFNFNHFLIEMWIGNINHGRTKITYTHKQMTPLSSQPPLYRSGCGIVVQFSLS